MPDQPLPPPSVSGPETGPAKPAEPGPREPPNIGASILPQRKRDAARHPKVADPVDGPLQQADDVATAEQGAVEAGAADDDDDNH